MTINGYETKENTATSGNPSHLKLRMDKSLYWSLGDHSTHGG